MSEATAAGNTATPNDPLVTRWIKEIELYEQKADKWHTRGQKIERRYKDERNNTRESKEKRYNILWSNIQTLLPALYSRNPKPDFQRRFLDADPVGRVTCEILERAVSFTLDKEDFYLTARQCVTDRLLPGRGTLWIRYVPHFAESETRALGTEIANEGLQVDDDAQANESPDRVQQTASSGEPIEQLDYEEVDIDYVHWTDFGHVLARTWQEVPAVWRKVYLTRKELVERFKEVGREVPLDYKPENLKGEEVTEYERKGCIYEIWDKRTRKVIWISKSFPVGTLDVRDDMLGLQDFFPCPRPMTPNMANDSVIPVPDFTMYQDQAAELDDLTNRIGLLTDAIRATGVYDSSVPGLQSILAGGYDNKLVPVDAWAAFAEKGGLKGAIELLPMEEIAQTLLHLYDARDRVKQDLYEITGMADIIRGASDPSETATAQQIKSNFASIRLEDMQAEVQRFARDTVVMVAEVLANQFDIQTLAEISGYPLMTGDEKAIAQQILTLGGDLPDEMEKPFLEPTWEEVDKLLRNTNMRHFRLDIETDSTLKMDQLQEKADRTELLKAVGDFLTAASNARPELVPLLGQMLMFAVRAFPVGKQLESALQATIDALEKKAKAMQDAPSPPTPEQIRANTALQIAQGKQQGEMAIEGARMQFEREKLAGEQQGDMLKARLDAWVAQQEQAAQAAQAAQEQRLEAQRAVLEQHTEMVAERMRAEMQAQTEAMKQQFALLIAQLNNAARVEVAEIAAQSTLDAAQASAARTATEGG
ncbi:molecular chaperone [Burkholderia stagnalis]|uniref:hypothetical protein n=1 Tax=Burkholderia stagnalis TaxID=1503054 RepID=UPI00075F2A36|nr:hypothetical protein [Burkholderia stagnalis]KVN72804.1 molecular chaperone [Burkholderia stagnalis]KWO38184.1 molecular chaperone [Burkholderia stagnalis]KWO41094.1 molecular chaperone [Burkholderia stagnalis]